MCCPCGVIWDAVPDKKGAELGYMNAKLLCLIAQAGFSPSLSHACHLAIIQKTVFQKAIKVFFVCKANDQALVAVLQHSFGYVDMQPQPKSVS